MPFSVRSPVGSPLASTSFAGLMSAADKLTLDRLKQLIAPNMTGAAYGTISVSAGFNDFYTGTGGTAPYFVQMLGAGAAATWGTGDTQRVGIVSLDTGTTTTGSGAIHTATTMFRFGGGICRTASALRIPVASDGTETFTVRTGFTDAYSAGGDATDGCFFRYAHSVNGGRWQAVNRSNGVENAMDSGVAGVSASIQTFEIEVNAAGTSAVYKIDGTVVATNTSNIPTGAGRETGLSTHILKSAGLTSRSLLVDWLGHYIERSANV